MGVFLKVLAFSRLEGGFIFLLGVSCLLDYFVYMVGIVFITVIFE
jgi:hypothetical protein